MITKVADFIIQTNEDTPHLITVHSDRELIRAIELEVCEYGSAHIIFDGFALQLDIARIFVVSSVISHLEEECRAVATEQRQEDSAHIA